LNDLVNNPAPDLKPQYATFNRNLDQLEASAKRNAAAATNVNRNATAYFRAWETQLESVNYEVIRNQGQARRAEVKKNFDEVNQQFHEAQSALLPLIDYLEDIRKSLGADLTVGGLQSVRGFLSNAQENAAKVQTALGKVSTQLASARENFASVLQTAKAEGTNAPASTPAQQPSEAKKQ
jgi:flagellar biosynthesis chaperone FliJ